MDLIRPHCGNHHHLTVDSCFALFEGQGYLFNEHRYLCKEGDAPEFQTGQAT
jgi:uncharacterized cupin superfamily protein